MTGPKAIYADHMLGACASFCYTHKIDYFQGPCDKMWKLTAPYTVELKYSTHYPIVQPERVTKHCND